MSFVPAVADQIFALDHIAGLPQLAATDRFATATPDVVAAIVQGVGDFATGEWAPLDRLGDTVGARLIESGVVMPAGYREAYRAFVEQGWSTVGVPIEAGGQGLPFCVATAVLETLGSANTGFAMTAMLTGGAIEALTHHGSSTQQSCYLPKLATGEWTGTMNLTEPQAGSDVGAVRTMATPRADGGFAIKGTKIYITFGDHDLATNIVHLVLARTPGAPAGTKGLSLFLVPKFRLGSDGQPAHFNDVRVVSIEHKMGLHASPTCVLSFGDQDECVGELVGEEYGGIRAMFTMMNNARLNVGLQGVQVAERSTQRAMAFARERVQGVRASAPGAGAVAIIEHPDVRRMLLRMKAQTMAARALVYYAAGQVDRAAFGDGDAKARLDLVTPLAKAHATDLGCEVASIGVQVHGGMGFIEETGAAQQFRDARITPIYEGTNGIQAADLVGRKLDLGGGAAFDSLIDEMRRDVRAPHLRALVASCDEVGRGLRERQIDDRLAASYPFLTMFATAVCGWLLERSVATAVDTATEKNDGAAMRSVASRFYLEQIVPEALGLQAAATATADILYAVPAEAFGR